MADLARAGGVVDRLACIARGLRERREKRVHRGLDSCADVEDRVRRRPHRGQVGGNDVADVDIVARGLAVTEDARLLARHHEVGEDGDDPRLAERVLPRTVDIRIAEDDEVKAGLGVRRLQVDLEGVLADTVGAKGRAGSALPDGELGRVAVDRAAAGGEDEPPPACPPKGHQQVQAANDVRLSVEGRVLGRDHHRGLGRQMVDDLRPTVLDDPRRGIGVADVDLVEGGLRVDVVKLAGGEVVDDGDVMACLDERVDDMGADEAGSAGDEYIGHCAWLLGDGRRWNSEYRIENDGGLRYGWSTAAIAAFMKAKSDSVWAIRASRERSLYSL